MRYILFLVVLLIPDPGLSDNLDCPCKVIEVTDGDAVHLLDRSGTKYHVILGGIDAPEKKQLFGEKSAQNLSRLIAGKSLEVEYNRRDRYGHIVGKLIKDSQDINLQQIKNGFAWHDKYARKDQSKLDWTLYSAAENEARNGTLGLWAVPAVPPWEYRKK